MSMFDMLGMMGKMKEAQARIKEMKENLIHLKETGESGGGMVKVTINGAKQLVNLEIEDSLMNPSEKSILQDLIVAATNQAIAKIEDKVKEEVKKTTDGLLPNIPGFDFNNM